MTDRLSCGSKQLSHEVACHLGRSQWRPRWGRNSQIHYLRAQSQSDWHHTSDRLDWERGRCGKRKGARQRSSLKGRERVHPWPSQPVRLYQGEPHRRLSMYHGSRRDQKIKRYSLRGGRWSWTLNFAQKRSWVGRWSWAEQVQTSFCFELSKLFVNSGAADIVLVTLSSTAVETAIAQCTSRWAMARGHRLNTSIVLAATVSPVFFGRFPRSSLSLSHPLPTLSPSLIDHLASVDVKVKVQGF